MKSVVFAIVLALAATANAALPPPTPEQVQAQAAKKAAADAQAAKDKQELLASMDALTARWRSRAAAKGWKANPPTAVAAAPAAVAAPANQTAPSGQPGGKLSGTGQAAPVSSEKAGTAPPSADVKQTPKPAPNPPPVQRKP
jgi:hypothetical protein